MYAAYRAAASSYQKLDVETAVGDADPHRLISMLFDGAMTAIGRARSAIAAGDVATRGTSIGRAVRIIDEGLKASVDRRGGDLAQNLVLLYEHMTVSLLEANLRSDDAALARVAELLRQLSDGWQGIKDQVPTRAAAAAAAA